MSRLLIINNIPTPYRTFMFNKLNDIGLEYGVEITVAYQAERMRDRSWSPDESEMGFAHFYSTGVNPLKKDPHTRFSYLTFNTDILREVASGHYDWVLTASLMSLGSWACSLVPSGETRKLLWSESNMASARFLRGPVRWFKGILEAPFSALVCPGERAVEYVRHLNPKAGSKPVLWLPNIVDTSIFETLVEESRGTREATRTELGVEDWETLLLGVGRLIELKGYGRLIDAAADVSGPYKIVLLGEGPLRVELTRLIDRVGLASQVHLLGEVEPATVARYLAAADWFVHAAEHDPSPLVVVEAATGGLPLAVSAQTGNSPEAVIEGVNGFTFDATDRSSVVEALEKIVGTSAEDRRAMGERSAELAENRFNPDTVVERFFEALLDV